MSSPKPHRKAETKKRKVTHAKFLTGSLHKSQLEAREAVKFKTDLKGTCNHSVENALKSPQFPHTIHDRIL